MNEGTPVQREQGCPPQIKQTAQPEVIQLSRTELNAAIAAAVEAALLRRSGADHGAALAPVRQELAPKRPNPEFSINQNSLLAPNEFLARYRNKSHRTDGDWDSGLFTGIFRSFPCGLLEATIFPCCVYDRIAKNIDKQFSSVATGPLGVCLFTFCHFPTPTIMHCKLRTAVRNQYNIKGEDIDDFCIVCWCSPCALVQV